MKSQAVPSEPRMAIKEIHGTPLSSMVLAEIREAIVRGELAPSETINQVEVSREFGISRAPLREALRQLEQEGLVKNVPYRGTIVAPLTARNIRELMDVRQLFESYAARQVVNGTDDSVFADLRERLKDLQSCADKGDIDGVNKADIAFHTRIVHAIDNRLVIETWDRYTPAIRRTLILRNRANLELQPLVALHEDLLDALESRDMERLSKAYAVHGADILAVLEPLLERDDEYTTP